MTKAEVLAGIREIGIVPVLRASSVERALALVDAIADGGVRCVEMTMTVPGALDAMRRLARERPGILLGAGTVLDPETARMCILEGAHFVVSPALNVRTVEMCHRYSVAVLPGALTPTEIVTAWEAGADLVKVFPASAMGGASYLKSVKAPLPQVELIPTGGVSQGTAMEYLQAGAFALGVGADLVDERAIAEGRAEMVTENARKYLGIVRQFRASRQDAVRSAGDAAESARGLAGE